MDRVVAFSWLELTRLIPDDALSAIVVDLHQRTADGKVAGIANHMEWFVLVGDRQDRRLHQTLFDGQEGFLALCVPNPGGFFLEQPRKRDSKRSVVARVLVQVRGEAKELAEFLDVNWHWPVRDRLDLFRIRAHTILAHKAAEDGYLAGGEDTLLQVRIKLVLAQQRKHLANMISMCFHISLAVFGATVDEHIVKVARCKLTHRPQQIGDASVERGWSIAQALWHHQPLPKHAAGSAHRREWDIRFTHEDLIEPV